MLLNNCNITSLKLGKNAKRPFELLGSGHYTPKAFILTNLIHKLYTGQINAYVKSSVQIKHSRAIKIPKLFFNQPLKLSSTLLEREAQTRE